MKLDSSDYIQMGITCVVTAGICYLLFNSRPDPEPCVPPPYVPDPYADHRISWDEAHDFMKAYEANHPLMIKSADGGADVPLQGFRFDAGQIQEILTHNLNGGSDPKADQLVIYLGLDETSTDPKITPNYCLIAAGVRGDVVLKSDHGNDKINSSVFDRADPCPPNCPTIK